MTEDSLITIIAVLIGVIIQLYTDWVGKLIRLLKKLYQKSKEWR